MIFDDFLAEIEKRRQELIDHDTERVRSGERWRFFSAILYPICILSQWAFLLRDGSASLFTWLSAVFMSVLFIVLAVLVHRKYSKSIEEQKMAIIKKKLLGEYPYGLAKLP